MKYLPDIDEAKAMEMLTELYGSDAERIADLYKEAYPEHPLAEVLFINSIPQGGFSRYGLINPENGWLKSFNDAGADRLQLCSILSATLLWWGNDVPYRRYSILVQFT